MDKMHVLYQGRLDDMIKREAKLKQQLADSELCKSSFLCPIFIQDILKNTTINSYLRKKTLKLDYCNTILAQQNEVLTDELRTLIK
jgi:hypothetical protein